MAVVTRLLPYHDDTTSLSGVLAWDAAREHQRPGLLLIHGGAGLDDHARGQAERYARLGYVVLACDMFGDEVAGVRERVMACLLELRDDPEKLRRRALAGLGALSGCPEVGSAFAAIGFCFGGMAALELARGGAPIAGVVSMHGSLATRSEAKAGAVTAKVLVCHGALDPHIPAEDVSRFTQEMTQTGADWQLIMYGGAVHGFTHTNAVPGVTPGVAYDERADRRSFAAATSFFAELT